MVAEVHGVYQDEATERHARIRVLRKTFREPSPATEPPRSSVRIIRRKRPYVSMITYGEEHDEPRLISPVVRAEVVYSEDDECWIASDGESLEYGAGETPEDALSDFIFNLHDMATWFRDNTRELSPFMQRRRRTFQRLFRGL